MDSQVEEIKSALDIVSVVQSYVPTLKASGRNHFGLCPFHKEKSPSFSVNPELQIYKCFGCGEGGDVLSFIQKVEGVEFPQALEIAAQRAGVDLKKFDSPQSRKRREEKERSLQAHKLAADYFYYLLTQHQAGKDALDYAMKVRGLPGRLVKKFQLGYAPKGYHNLENFLMKRGFKRQELISFGLLASKNGRVYDKFRNRLMHPIFGARGEVIGFSGRAIDPDDLGPKYLNSPETSIYHKKDSLYGLWQAKDMIRNLKTAIIVEGNIDVISSYRAGIENIVCPLGTALTPEQLKLIHRYAETVLFAFDTDFAGKKALLRSLELTEREGLEAKAIVLGDYKDVDEMVVASRDKWKEAVADAKPIPEFIMEIFRVDYNLADANEKLKYLEQVLPFIAKLRDQVKIDHYLQKLELISGTKYDILLDKLNKIGRTQATAPQQEEISTPDPAEEEARKQPSVNRRLQLIIQYIYAWKPRLQDVQKLKDIYQNSLAHSEADLLTLTLADNVDTEKGNVKNFSQSKEQLVTILSTQNQIGDFDTDNPQSEVEQMIKNYVRSRLREYLSVLKLKAQQETSENASALLNRISEYAKKLKEVD